jgi:hypothetical protein
MLQRFARLCGWLGNGTALVLIGLAIFVPMAQTGDRSEYVLTRVLFFVVPAVVIFLVCHAVKYVIVGSQMTPEKMAAWRVFGIGWLVGMVVMVVLPAMGGKPILWPNLGWWIDNLVSAAVIGAIGVAGWRASRKRPATKTDG